MKLRKKEDYVELPESLGDGRYIELRSSERIDVRTGERLDVATGVEAYIGKTETLTVTSTFCKSRMVYSKLGKYVELLVRVKNKGKRNIMIHPGEPIASMLLDKPKTKKATIKTKATWRN